MLRTFRVYSIYFNLAENIILSNEGSKHWSSAPGLRFETYIQRSETKSSNPRLSVADPKLKSSNPKLTSINPRLWHSDPELRVIRFSTQLSKINFEPLIRDSHQVIQKVGNSSR